MLRGLPNPSREEAIVLLKVVAGAKAEVVSWSLSRWWVSEIPACFVWEVDYGKGRVCRFRPPGQCVFQRG